MGHLIGVLTPLPDCIASLCFLLVAVFILTAHLRRIEHVTGWLRKLAPVTTRVARGTRRGLSIQVTGRAIAHRALVEHSAAFLDRPTGAVPSTILTRDRHHNILSAPYGPYWRAVRRNVAAGVLHPSRLFRLSDTRARVLGDLARDLRSGAPAAESLYFAVYSVLVEMCFGKDVVSKLGDTRLRAMQKFQRDILVALPSFGVLVRYPRMSKLIYPSRWRQLLSLRRQQEESFLPLVAEVKNNRKDKHDASFKTYVESLLDLRIHEDGGRAVTDGELVSLISEFLGAGLESTAAALQWTMANLVKRPDLQQKLRIEVDAIGCNQRIIEEAELSRMPYLKAVVLESLRRHPPFPFVVRRMEGKEAAEAVGLTSVPGGGATVNFLVGKIARDAVPLSDATEFTPERFMPGGDGEDTDLTCTRELRMMPFGAGRRACPAIVPAMLHLEYFVANLVKEFEWWEADGEDNAVNLTEFRGFFITVMDRPLRARLVPRDAV
ncbi:cytochrome P450 89A2-like [Triticum dicoccoides]|uniref:cytochrome P450 89A2-like n=1 Tax=Triticum dicoccoides TaxID=85692 RepID=UPI00188E8F87|nr:cytochrome P450 89A2-like [Triticum dicoccoides]